MTETAIFKATYSDWRLVKGRKVVQIVFELPLEVSNDAYKALGGMPNPAVEKWFAIARLVLQQPEKEANEDIVHPAQPSLEPTPGRARPDKLVTLAGMLSRDPMFHRYLEKVHDFVEVTDNTATNFIRFRCNVISRSHITSGSAPGEEFLRLYDDFKLWRDSDTFLEAE